MGDYIFGTMLSIMLLGLLMGGFIALAVYFLPVIIAAARKHKQIIPITLITIFIGWTFLGWLAAILWSLNSDTKDNENCCCDS